MSHQSSENLRVLLVGKTGSGKSSTGNLMFNDPVFGSRMSPSSVTRVSQSHTGAVDNRRVTLVDTPDFRFSTHTDFDSDSELKRALELCSPGAHVILLILTLSTFTQQEMDFIHWFEQKFGEEVLRFTLVLFTQADKPHMRTLAELIRGNTELSGFINRCGQRYHELKIKAPADRRQVTELMEKINRLVSENRNSCYTLEMMHLEDKALWKRVKHLLLLIKLKHVCVILFFAVMTGGVWVWRKDSSHTWPFIRGFTTGGSAAAAGVFIQILWRLMIRSQFICSSSPERPSAVRQFLLKIGGVVCAFSFGAAIGHFLGGNELPVTVLTGLAGAAGALIVIR